MSHFFFDLLWRQLGEDVDLAGKDSYTKVLYTMMQKLMAYYDDARILYSASRRVPGLGSKDFTQRRRVFAIASHDL